jgi:AcrR family transcriptional regulator
MRIRFAFTFFPARLALSPEPRWEFAANENESKKLLVVMTRFSLVARVEASGLDYDAPRTREEIALKSGSVSRRRPVMSTFDTSPHVLRPQQERSRAALAKIVQAAEKLLRKNGIDGFSMAAVAEAADLPVGNIYRRFKGKDELLQAIKHDVTSRIEMAAAARLSQQQFSDIPTLVRALVGAASKTFASDETLYRIVFDSRTQNPVLNQIGLSGRHRIFAAYREALLPFLDGVPKSRAELLVRVSFHLLAAAIVGKARADDGALADLSWNVLESEIGTAAIAYLETSIRAGAKPIRPTRIRTSGTRKAR